LAKIAIPNRDPHTLSAPLQKTLTGDGRHGKYTRQDISLDIIICANILPLITCGDVVVGARKVVVNNITEPAFYLGNPARKLL
jgi:serine acetyltransferase